MRARFVVPLVLFVALVGLFAAGLKLDPKLVPSPLIDQPAPRFTLPKLSDSQASFTQEEFRGKVSLLNVWASWCVSCRIEHPLLVELAQSGRVPIYGLNYKDGAEDAKRWLAYYGDPYRSSAHDAQGRVGIEFGVYGVPETFLIDGEGRIRYKHIGPLDKRILDEKILPLIADLEARRS
ncbi:MAG: DsbE family thiol:disulfide interchange protein [Burkholderiales bacterium]